MLVAAVLFVLLVLFLMLLAHLPKCAEHGWTIDDILSGRGKAIRIEPPELKSERRRKISTDLGKPTKASTSSADTGGRTGPR